VKKNKDEFMEREGIKRGRKPGESLEGKGRMKSIKQAQRALP
jgi:hypothetical protein